MSKILLVIIVVVAIMAMVVVNYSLQSQHQSTRTENIPVQQSTQTVKQSTQESNPEIIPTACNAVNAILPDPKCTPGAADPAVTQNNIDSTICVSGYTKTVRPPVSVTGQIKRQVMQAYGFTDSSSNYELDHLIPLEVGGAPADVRNLWPESAHITPNFHDKDKFENYLHRQVCSREMDLKTAQYEISTNWFKYWDEAGRP